MALNVVTSINFAVPGATTLTTRIVPEFLKVFEPNLVMWKFSEAPISEKGYNSVTWNKPNKLTLTPAQALLTPGVTPISQGITADSITVASQQYGLYVTLTDEILARMEGRQIPGLAADLTGANMGRIIDRVVQDAVLDNAQNRFFCSSTSGGARAANRAALTQNDHIFAYDLVTAHTILQGKSVPYHSENSYIAIMHPNVYHWLQTETGIGGFLTNNQYLRPDRIDKGEMGMLSNVRLVVSPFIKTYASNITVYPTLFIGYQAYGASQLMAMEMITKALGSAGTSDPLNQRMTIGCKTFFASTILQQDAVLVLEGSGYQG